MKELSFEKFVEKAFWLMLTGIIGFGVKGVSDLNTKMTTVITQLGDQNRILDDHGKRILYLERHAGKNGP